MAQCVCVRCGEETAVLKSRKMDVVSVPENRSEKCLVFQCSKCNAVLGCQLDLAAFTDSLVRRITDALRPDGPYGPA